MLLCSYTYLILYPYNPYTYATMMLLLDKHLCSFDATLRTPHTYTPMLLHTYTPMIVYAPVQLRSYKTNNLLLFPKYCCNLVFHLYFLILFS
jgi:hypothetical protein